MTHTINDQIQDDVSPMHHHISIDKKAIPELMIPAFETSIADDNESNNHITKPLISPDSLGATTNSTMASSSASSSAEVMVSASTSGLGSPEFSSSQLEEESCASSPTNPSAPINSPEKRNRPPVNVKDGSRKNSSPPPPPPIHPVPNHGKRSRSDENDNALNSLNAPPAPLSHRERVKSLDRGGYMSNLSSHEFNDDDDDISSSSINSSDDSDGEGSYFSEHLPSPPRRRQSVGSNNRNHRLLPPGSSSMNSRSSKIHMPNLHSHHHSHHHQQHYSQSHESDLSLSSSSCEDEHMSLADDLEQQYALSRTASAPVQTSVLHLRQSSNDSSKHYHSDEPPLKYANEYENGSSKAYYQQPDHEIDNDDRKLKIIGQPMEEYLSIPLPKNGRRFPSTSSLVSSSSEDVERKHKSGGNKHRRQSSYRSVGSITSAGSAHLPEKPKKWSHGDPNSEPSKPPELVSFGSLGSSRHSKSSSSRKTTPEHRVPRSKPFNDTQKMAILSDDQMNLWRNGGIVRSDSYVSSSNGNVSGPDISPDRKSKNCLESASISNGSKHSKSAGSHMSQMSKSGSGIFVYSEDETDESMKYEEMNGNPPQSEDNPEISASASNDVSQAPTATKRQRSFGKDLTNAEAIEPSSRNATINPSPDSRHSRQHPHRHDMMSSLSSMERPAVNMPYDMIPNMDNVSTAGSMMTYRVYWKRWLMLLYISLLNLLSDWTCFSVAPIALLTTTTFQIVNPEHLVTVFLLANTISTATEPIILARLGLRRTIVFGSFLLMCGNIIKSGGIPGILGDGLVGENNVWRIYAGFFLVGLSQPLYQCTPSILSSSWFPEKERTLATGVALNSNQLGIGCSFIFGSLLVVTSDDIAKYFGLLSTLSTLVFIGCYFQFQDAPPTPPSETARVIRGNTVFPYMSNIQQKIPHYFRRNQGPIPVDQMGPMDREHKNHRRGRFSSGSAGSTESKSSANKAEAEINVESKSSRRSHRSERRSRGSPTSAFKSMSSSRPRKGSSDGSHGRSTHRRQRSHGSKSIKSSKSEVTSRSRRRRSERVLAPSPASGVESTEDLISAITQLEEEATGYGTVAPSPMMSGRVSRHGRRDGHREVHRGTYYDTPQRSNEHGYQQQWQHPHYGPGSEIPVGLRQAPVMNYYGQHYNMVPDQMPLEQTESYPDTPFANLRDSAPPMSGNYPPHMSQTPYAAPYDYGDTPHQFYPPMGDPRYYYQQPPVPPEYYNYQQPIHAPSSRPLQAPMYPQPIPLPPSRLPSSDEIDDGVEPVLTHAGASLSIAVRDDQIIRSIRACFSRPGFVQTVIAFAVSGIVLNTISTYIDCLLRLDGAGRGSVGLIGGSFQVLVMISSLIFGKITDKTRAYYCVVIGLLVMGAFTLAECAINLEAGRGEELKWTLLILAIFVGPLQPVATELGVDV
jgi:MFS family permease